MEHIYGAIRKDLYPKDLHEQLRLILPYSNLCAWQINRKESGDDYIGTNYIGIEEENISEENKTYLESLGFMIVGDSSTFNAWVNLYGQINDNIID